VYHPAMRSRLACLSAVLLVSLAVSACHSSGHSATPADGAVGGSGGGGAVASDGAAAGSTGGTGVDAPGSSVLDAAAAGSTGGTGVDAPGGSATGASDAAVAMTPLQTCRAAITALAERRALCRGTAVQGLIGAANACPDYYFNADSNRTVANVAACLGTLAALTCTDIALNLVPACLAGGNGSEGDPCAYGSQCQSNACKSSGTQCSTCQSETPLGGPCGAGSSYCQGDSFCNFGTGLCTDAHTIVYAKQGEPCDLIGTPVVGCEGDLQCLGPSSPYKGTCTAPPGSGQPCSASNGICAAGATCSVAAGWICLAAGDCGAGLQCDANSYCRAGDGGLTCLPRATVGQPCDDSGSSALPPCLAPAVCYVGTCVVPTASGAQGDTCDVNNPCRAYLYCVAGTCQPFGSICPNGHRDGGTG
jgi:hypothetical protein